MLTIFWYCKQVLEKNIKITTKSRTDNMLILSVLCYIIRTTKIVIYRRAMKRKYEKELEEIFKILKSSNNKDCFVKFYDNYKILVYKIAFTILKNKDDSEDIVQTVLLI